MAKTKKQSQLELEIQDKCIAIVDQERVNWEDAVVFINPKVAFRFRELIRIFRKNFWGVFDDPIDRNTGREKLWIHLAQSTVETWVKNTDISLRDLLFLPRHPDGHETNEITKFVVKDYLERLYFNEIIDADARACLTDGTVVWKTWEDTSSGKPVLKRRTVDLLNWYIDPTEENIQSAYRVTERGILTPDQIAGMSGWMNTRGLDGSQTVNRNDGSRRSNFGSRTTGMYRDVWETWGKIPKWVVTGDKKADDANEEIDGHIVISGLEAGGAVLHLVEENTKKDKFGNSIKPYEEWRAAKVSGRWYGLGPIERILALQEYLNTLVNIRITRSYVSQLGLFKIRKGKGITAQMLSRLPVNGAIQVTDMDDIQQLQVDEASEASYRDEDVIKYWAQQVSSAFPISSGDTMPASTTATVGSIANTNAKSAYSMFKQSTATFLERWIDRHALPIIAKTVSIGDVYRIEQDDENFKKLTEHIALNEGMAAVEKSGVMPTLDEFMAEVDRYQEKLLASPSVLLKSVKKIIADALDTKMKVTNVDIDSSVILNNLIQMLNVTPEYREGLVRDIYDIMGLEMPKAKPPMMQQGPSQPAQGQPQNAQSLLTSALQPIKQ